MRQNDQGPGAGADPAAGQAGQAGVFEREDVVFTSGAGSCAAWLYRPAGAVRPPVVVMAHGFGAPRELRLDAYAERFAAAGYGVVVFDYRSFGESPGEPRRLLRISAQQEDWRAALKFARSHPALDGRRVVAWGTSLGGGHVLHLAARDDALAAIVVQVPHVSGVASSLSGGIGHGLRVTAAAIDDVLRSWTGRSARYIPLLADSGRLGAMTMPDSAAVLRGLAGPISEEKVERESSVCARSILQMPWYSPGRTTGRITAPALFQIADHDVLTPPRVALEAAGRIGGVEIKHYQCGHFEPYLPPHFDAIVADQLGFLARVVPVSAG